MADLNALTGAMSRFGQAISDTRELKRKQGFEDKLNPLIIDKATSDAANAKTGADNSGVDLGVKKGALKSYDDLNTANDAATPEELGMPPEEAAMLPTLKTEVRLLNTYNKTSGQKPVSVKEYYLAKKSAQEKSTIDNQKTTADVGLVNASAKKATAEADNLVGTGPLTRRKTQSEIDKNEADAHREGKLSGKTFTNDSGVLMKFDSNGNAVPVTDASGNPVKSQAKGGGKTATPEAAKAALNETLATYDRLIAEAKAIKDSPGLKKITGVMSVFPNMPGGQAADTEARMKTLKAQAAFSVLQSLRSQSKTGGALGQISDKEEEMLQNALAGISNSQSTGAMQDALDRIIQFGEGSKGRLSKGYTDQYGDALAATDKGAAPKQIGRFQVQVQ